ncbi:MAG: CoA-transferase [Chloroflexota bacterium]
MTTHIEIADAALLIDDNVTFALGGMTLYRRPVSFVRELLRRNTPPQNLTLLAFTAGYAADMLVGAGIVSRVRTVYFGLEAFGLAPMFTYRANRGEIDIVEETEASIVMGLRATVSGVGFLPSVAWQGTDMFTVRPDVKQITDPYTGQSLTAFPAIPVDVAVIHALEADARGNIAINNNLAIDQLLVYAADTVIVTVERFVEQLSPSPDRTIIPAPGIDYLVHAPDGAYPTSCYPLYTLTGREFAAYSEAATTEAGFQQYLTEYLQR